MYKIFNKKVLYIIPFIFLIVIIFRITYSYQDAKREEYNFVQKEAESLNSFAMAHRDYYQKLFINKTLPLDEKTLPALPAFASSSISERFSKLNPLHIRIQTVSDRARNPMNNANEDELKAINFFKKNPKEKNYFNDQNSKFYQYAYALRIENACIICHGKKEDAPQFIQDNYDNAYNYKLGELRGIMSIEIPKDDLNAYFLSHFFRSTAYDFSLFVALFLAIYYLIKKSQNINDFLDHEVKSKTKELKDSLLTDGLSKLPNRLKLLEDLEEKKNSPAQHLALLNIDRFKDINDFYGHEIGDKVLQHTALSIQSICKHINSMIYKLPSDEFAIFSTRDISADKFYEIVDNIISVIQETAYEIDGNSIFITVSCGIVSNTNLILTKADMALQVSKNDKHRIIVYDETLDSTQTINKNLQGVTLLKQAIKNDAITPYFQPIYNMKTQQIEKYEVLARIIQEDGEVIAPYQFLDIAIKSKLYPNITKAMIRKSFAFFKDKDYEFSINLSINDVLNKNTLNFIIQSLQNYSKPEQIVFEILESDKIGNYVELKEFITTVKKFACKIAIDDFGSGYSNFSHILELDVDYLKIDASLVKNVTTDENARKITRTIIRFASSLDIKTIAEFVEDEASLNLLQEMGIDFIQGYYIGKPKASLV